MKTLLKKILNGMGYRVQSIKYTPKTLLKNEHLIQLTFDHVLTKYLYDKNAYENFTFIQIGAFDGVMCDPLYKYLIKHNWRGIMLEPQPMPFQKLKALYVERPKMTLLNAAISKNIGKQLLYTLEGENLPEWAKGMASFSIDNILKHKDLIPEIQDTIKKIEIETVTFENIISDNHLVKIDLLQVDTEGFDANVILMFPFDKVKPSIIHFESKHIAKQELEQLLDYLISKNYMICKDGDEDMLAVIKE